MPTQPSPPVTPSRSTTSRVSDVAFHRLQVSLFKPEEGQIIPKMTPSPLRRAILTEVKTTITKKTTLGAKEVDSRGDKGRWGRMWEERRQREVTAIQDKRVKEDMERKVRRNKWATTRKSEENVSRYTATPLAELLLSYSRILSHSPNTNT